MTKLFGGIILGIIFSVIFISNAYSLECPQPEILSGDIVSLSTNSKVKFLADNETYIAVNKSQIEFYNAQYMLEANTVFSGPFCFNNRIRTNTLIFSPILTLIKGHILVRPQNTYASIQTPEARIRIKPIDQYEVVRHQQANNLGMTLVNSNAPMIVRINGVKKIDNPKRAKYTSKLIGDKIKVFKAKTKKRAYFKIK